MNKETMARVIHDEICAADRGAYVRGMEYADKLSEAVIKAQQAEAPKELMDCKLSPEELEVLQEYVEPDNESIGYELNIATEQLKKVAPYIEAQVKAGIRDWITTHQVGFTMGNDLEHDAKVHHASYVSYWHIPVKDWEELKQEENK